MTTMRLLKPAMAGLGLALAVSGCTNPYSPGQRALGGGVIGAGTGAAIGGLAGGGHGAAMGALIGGAVGAVGGAVTTPTPPPPATPAYPPLPPQARSPEMVWLPSPGVYVAQGYGYPLFFYGRSYYYSYGGYWYSGPSYRGPWRSLRAPPPPLRHFRPGDWNGYQARARGYYPANPNWRHFRPR